uniref:Serpin domain-containing protein n=1 Tax=Neogobius melanostomus TaxID=47308 RepID=A0A8C6T1U3_9GOBI
MGTNTCFALDLFKKFGDNDRTANVFYSPFSISSALAMVLLGAGGNTATQMSEVTRQAHSLTYTCPFSPQCLKTSALSDDVHSQFGSLLPQLDRSDAPYALNVANRLYGEQTYQFVENKISLVIRNTLPQVSMGSPG